MIEKLANQLATDVGIKLSSVELEDGRPLGCSDVHLLTIKSKGMLVHATINNGDIFAKSAAKVSDLTKEKIRKALDRLKINRPRQQNL
jgi:hypothetical protein